MRTAGRTISIVAAAFTAFAFAAFVALPSTVLAQDSSTVADSSANDDSGQVLEVPQVYTPPDQSCETPPNSSSADPTCPPSQASSDLEQYANQGQPTGPMPAMGDINAYMNQQSMAEAGAMVSPYGLAAAPMAVLPFYPMYPLYVTPSVPTVVSPAPPPPAPRPVPRPHFPHPHFPAPPAGSPFGSGFGHGMPHLSHR